MDATSFQWFLNGFNINGGTTDTLTITDVRQADAGEYYVLVTNLAGAVESDRVTLTVECKFKIMFACMHAYQLPSLGRPNQTLCEWKK